MTADRYKSQNEYEDVKDDGLFYHEVGEWSIEKHRIIGFYAHLFASATKNKWPRIVYVDAFSGPGRAKVKETNKFIVTSPIRALKIDKPFDHYIFCDIDKKAINSLEKRIELEFADKIKPSFLTGDFNERYPEIVSELSARPGTLTLCFLDPYDIGLHFNTVRELSKSVKVDFLILFALGMDANRNLVKYYLPETSTKVERFLDDPDWRIKWKDFVDDYGGRPVLFLAREYCTKMEELGYLSIKENQLKAVKYGERILYYLALFSKDKLAYNFWDKILTYVEEQMSFQFP